MSSEQTATPLDLIRWSFTINPEKRGEIEAYLVDLGLDVLVHENANFIVSWEEPEGEVEAVIEEIWALNGAPFEVTQEDFHRIGMHTLQQDEEAAAAEAA